MKRQIRKYYLALIFLLIVFILISLTLPLLSYQEARRAVIIQESLLNKSLLPTYNGEPYFTKPPLHTWLSLPLFAIGYSTGLEISFLHLLSFLSYFLTGYLPYLLCERDPKKTLLSLFILFSSYRFLSFIYRIDLEPLFIFFSTGDFYFLVSFLRTPSFQKAFLFCLSMALAFLVRGPLNFFWFPALGVYALLNKDCLAWRLLFFLPGWLLLSAIILSWFLWGYLSFGKEVFSTFFTTDIGERLTARKDPFYYYFKAFFLNFLPYFLILLFKAKEILQGRGELLQFPKNLYLALYLVPLILLSFTGEKYEKYLLFLYPATSLFLAPLLLSHYGPSLLLRLSLLLVIINYIAVIALQLFQLEDLKFKTKVMAENINVKEKYTFYLESHPFILYLLKKPVPIIKEREGIPLALRRGTLLLSPREIKGLSPKRIIPDPYKKGKYWYLYN